MNKSFDCYRIHNDAEGYRSGVQQITLEALTAGDVIIDVHYSSVNYKDALAGTGKGKILRQFPLNGGIDCSGIVMQSDCQQFSPGDAVLVTGSGLSETRDGGYSGRVRIPQQHVIALDGA